MADVNIAFKAPPTGARMMKSKAFFRLLAGPVGSGKTVCCIFEILAKSMAQKPAADGYRYTRHAIVRQTFEQLRMTVLKDIEQWLGPLVTWKISDKTVYVEFGDVRSEWLLIPLENVDDQKRLLSSQLTGAWMSECIEIDVNLVGALLGRLGRYPSGDKLGVGDQAPTWWGCIADTNMPTEGSDWHKRMSTDIPSNWDIHIQPGGMEPDAENLDHLPGGRAYYENLIEGSPSIDWTRRYVHAQYGNDPAGQAVFKESFNRSTHINRGPLGLPEEMFPSLGHPLIVPQDFGRNPCALICQLDHRARLLVLEEIVSQDMGLKMHVDRNLRPALAQERYLGRPIYLVGDPAGVAKNSHYEETSFDLLKRAGYNAFPAGTNDLEKRLRAVEAFLTGQRDGGPAIIIDETRCPKLVRALAGSYRYVKMKNGETRAIPEKKHPDSDLVDCLQYACLFAHGGQSDYVATRLGNVGGRAYQRMPTGAWT